MLTLVIVLYVLGWLLTVAAVFIAATVTTRAVESIERERAAVLAQLRADIDAATSDEERERIAAEKFDRLRARLVPPGSAMGAGNVVQASQFTMLRVARANVPSAIVVLTGGAASTAASVMSLFL